MQHSALTSLVELTLVLPGAEGKCLKGIVHQFFFRCSNLIFWIVMGCGIADFVRRGLCINGQNSTFLGFHFVPRDLDSQRRGPRLAAPLMWVKVPWRRESRSLVAPRVEVPGDKMKTQKCWVWAFIDPSGQNQLYHTPLLSKIWDLNDRKNCEQSL